MEGKLKIAIEKLEKASDYVKKEMMFRTTTYLMVAKSEIDWSIGYLEGLNGPEGKLEGE